MNLPLLLLFSSFTVIYSFEVVGPGYNYSCYGKCNDISTPTKAGTMMIGGGTDVDEGFRWMIDLSGGGNFVVIRTYGTDAYNKYIYELGPIHSVSTIIITSREGSNSRFVHNIIVHCEALFIAGGDQNEYITLWNQTKLQKGIQHIIKNNVPIGGTSAGLNVLGDWIFTAETGGITSEEALENPYSPDLTLGNNFLHVSPFLDNIIFDTHFYQRDRMGRSVTFLARLITDHHGNLDYHVISVDEQTAILLGNNEGEIINQDGSIELTHSAYFITATQVPTVCLPEKPLTFYNISVSRLEYKDKWDFQKWEPISNDVVQYYLNIEEANITSTQEGGYIY